MQFSQVIDYIVVRAGEYVTVDDVRDDLGLSVERLWNMLDPDIAFYEEYYPLIKRFNIVVASSNGGGGTYDFNYDPHNTGYIGATFPKPSITQTGTPGTTLYGYQVFALDEYGKIISASLGATTVFGAAILSGTDSNVISWEPFENAVEYHVYRYVTRGTPNTNGLIWCGTPTTMIDTGLTGNRQLPPNIYGTPPTNITRCVPTGFRQNIINWSTFKTTRGFPGQFGRVPIPRQVVPVYRDGHLTLTEPGTMDVEAVYNPRARFKMYDSNQQLVDVLIPDLNISSGNHFLLDLLYGRFMVSLGSMRTSFIHTDQAITTSGEKMIEMGEEAIKTAKEEIYASQDISRTIRL